MNDNEIEETRNAYEILALRPQRKGLPEIRLIFITPWL
jgi:hypothetical protein